MAELIHASRVGGDLTVLGTLGAGAISSQSVVRAKYRLSAAAQSIPGATWTIINYDTKEEDTHGAVTTGSGWIFTAPLSGLYNVSACAFVASGYTYVASETYAISIIKTGIEEIVGRWLSPMTASATNFYLPSLTANTILRLQQGQTLSIRIYCNYARALYAGGGVAAYSHVDITRIRD